MNLETATLLLRELNTVLGLTAFFWLMFKSAKHWDEYPLAIQAYSMALMFFAFSAAYTSAESIAQDTQPGLRSVFVLIANLSLLFALWQVRGRHTFGSSEKHKH